MKTKHNFKWMISRTLMLVSATVITLFTSCNDEDGAPPTAPQIQTISSLPIQLGQKEQFNVTISAAGKLKEVTVTATKGSAMVKSVEGIGQATGTAMIEYTAPEQLGTASITVVVMDNANQNAETTISVDISALPPLVLNGGNVEGEWGPFRTINVKGSLAVPAGKSLTVREGTTIIIDGDGTQGNSPEISVAGNFYSYGTAEHPVLFTVPEAKRTQSNIFAGLWGGILGTGTSQEMVVLHTRIEYVGGPAAAGSYIVTSGEVKEGDPRYGLYFTNPNGTIVMQNSTIAYSKDDGMRVNQGKFLIAYNTFILNGQTGGESLNLKSGAVGDVAYNVFYQAATNAIKFSNSDDRTPQMEAFVYNNTALNCGWRQTKSGRGGSFNLEKGGKGKIYNNIITNCKFGVRFPKSPDNPDVANSTAGYNLYFGNHADIAAQFYPSTIGTITKGDYETSHDVSGIENENNPNFVNFNVTNFDRVAAANPANMVFPPDNINLKPNTGSPAINKAKTTGFTSRWASHTVGGKTYTVPQAGATIGAVQ